MRIVFRDFPLSFHKNAHKAAQAAQCAREQDKFWEYHDVLFANARALKPAQLKKYAVDLELNAEQFNGCLDAEKYRKDVDRDMKEGGSYGVTGTPAFFVNGRFLSGAQPFEKFASIIDEELEFRGIPNPRAKSK